jgi:F-type H+-transporting ATPase subunit a
MYKLGGLIAIGALFPFAVCLFIGLLELGVALIQAYVFCLLTTIYLAESIHLH